MTTSELQRFGVEADSSIFRVGPTRFIPMSVPPRSLQGRGRFDDSTIESGNESDGYAVLYAATEIRAAFLEAMYQFRTPLSRLKEVANEMVLDTQERDSLFRYECTISGLWLSNVALYEAQLVLDTPLFDLANPTAIQLVREELAPVIYALGIDDLDFGAVLGSHRRLTQAISRWLWTLETDSGQPMFSGIRYRSRFDPECICLALYQDRYTVSDIDTQPITPETPGFAEATSILRLKIA